MSYLNQNSQDSLALAAQQNATQPTDPQASNDPNSQQPTSGWLQQQQIMQQAAAQQATQQAAPNPTPTGTNTVGQIVTANMPTMQQIAQQNAANSSGWSPPAGYLAGAQQVDPSKLSGIGQEGYAKGMLAGQTYLNNKDSNARANELQSFQRQEFTKQQQISMGMQQAAAQGGYGGVIQYLQTADPERAIKFQDMKEQLDQDMLKSSSMSILNKQEQQQALFAGYGLLGKMGATILAAPQGEREGLYQNMLPLVQAVVPNAPNNLNDATPMLMLGAGQAMPDSVRWQLNTNAVASAGTVEKASDRVQQLINAGVGNSDPQMLAAKQDLQEAQNNNILNNAKVTELQSKQAANDTSTLKDSVAINGSRLKNIKDFQENYDKQSKTFIDMQNAMNAFNSAKASWQQEPNNPSAQQQMVAAVSQFAGIKRINPNVMNYMLQTDSKAGDLLNQIESIANSKDAKQLASQETIGRINALGTATMQKIGEQQGQINSIYQPMAQKYLKGGNGNSIYDDSNSVNWHNIPSSLGGNPAGTVSKMEIDAWAQQKIAQGVPPNQVSIGVQNAYKANGITQ